MELLAPDEYLNYRPQTVLTPFTGSPVARYPLRITNLAQSALDYSWMDQVDASHGVFITAEGLLMYLQPEDAMGLITKCAKRFPGGQLIFDLPPVLVKKLAPKGMRATRRYRVPPMPFSLSVLNWRT